MRTSAKAIDKIALIYILGVACGTTIPLGLQQSFDVLAQGNADPVEVSPVKPHAGDADRLRTSPGESLVPTIANPFTFKESSRTLPTSSVTPINSSIEAIPPVTPYIPNASPVSPARDSPGALTTDPVRAFPLIDSNYSETQK
ncbi:hypothetical protein [Pseudanabaena sp. PCC 6802]|uniref:hypothetical protein n=1 Tax=Pseudanabaena sp. PCC 6802 TaxID=118173 RepID=UPI00034892F4|nr:hypothetical protein [Pseudanabaena sp. PCC 6802]